MTRVFLHTFGCKANQYDTELVRQALEDAGAAIVAEPAAADAAVVNSCTVTHVGEAKLRGLVRRLARRRPGLRTVIMGCAAAVDDGALAALPGVIAVQGGADPQAVLDALGLRAPAHPTVLLRRFARGTRAWLKVQDGCDEHCTFCATVLARGPSRSRPAAEVIAEAGLLAGHADEIVVTGIHVGGYGGEGRTASAPDATGRSPLGALLAALVREVPTARFRLSSVEATELDPTVAALMAERPERLAPHLHAPLQSGSDRLLRRMGRHWYTATEYRRRIEAIAARLPVFALGADVIVGFPGETADDHAATRAVLADLPFTYVHVFPYSARPGAAAPRLGDPVEPGLMQERSAELRALVDAKARLHATRRLGAAADVVLLDRHAGRVQGLTEDYLTVTLPVDAVPATRFAARLAQGREGLTARPMAA